MNDILEDEVRSELERVGATVDDSYPEQFHAIERRIALRRRASLRTRTIGGLAAGTLALTGSFVGGRAVLFAREDDGQRVVVVPDSGEVTFAQAASPDSYLLPLTLPGDAVIDKTVTGASIANVAADGPIVAGGDAPIWSVARVESDTMSGWIATTSQRDSEAAEAPVGGTVETIEVLGGSGQRVVNANEIRIRFVRNGRRVESAFRGASGDDALMIVNGLVEVTEDDWKAYDEANQQTDGDPDPETDVYVMAEPVRPPLLPTWLPEGMEVVSARDQFGPGSLPASFPYAIESPQLSVFGTKDDWIAIVTVRGGLDGYVPVKFGNRETIGGGSARFSSDLRAASWDRGLVSLLVLSKNARSKSELLDLVLAASLADGANVGTTFAGRPQVFRPVIPTPARQFHVRVEDRKVSRPGIDSCLIGMSDASVRLPNSDPDGWHVRIQKAFAEGPLVQEDFVQQINAALTAGDKAGFGVIVTCNEQRGSVASYGLPASKARERRILEGLEVTNDANWETARNQILRRTSQTSASTATP